MARPISGTNLSLVQLQQFMEVRRHELVKLRRKRAAAQREVDVLDRQIDRIEGGLGGRRGGNGRARNEKSLNDTIEQVLKGSGKPMKVADIVDAVQRAGYRSSSANFRGIVNQMLIKDKRFTASERGMYHLKKAAGAA